MTLLSRLSLFALLLGGLPGCEAITNIQQATEPLDAYELRTPEQARSSRATLGNISVELPTSTGALDTDRIAIKPDPLKVQYLPTARWVDRGTVHFQLLLVRTLSSTGRFGFVTGETSGPTPDYVLLTDLTALQAEIRETEAGTTIRAVVRAEMTLLNDIDRQVIATRVFESASPATSAEAPDIMTAFDRAVQAALAQAADWVVGALR